MGFADSLHSFTVGGHHRTVRCCPPYRPDYVAQHQRLQLWDYEHWKGPVVSGVTWARWPHEVAGLLHGAMRCSDDIAKTPGMRRECSMSHGGPCCSADAL